MSIAAIPVAIVAGLTLYAGGFHALVYVAGGRKRRDLTFALLALGVSVYDLLSMALYFAPSFEVGSTIARAELVVGFGLFVGFTLFLADCSGRPMPLWVRAVAALHGLVAVYTLVDPFGLVLTKSPSVLRLDGPLLGPVVYYEQQMGPLGASVLAIGGVTLVAYLVVVGRWLARDGRSADAGAILLAGFVVLVGIAHDVLVSLRLLPQIYILAYTNAGVVLLMARTLNRDVVEAARTKDALLASEARVRAVLESIPDAVVVLDVHGQVVDLNPAAVDLVGASRGAILGRWIGDIAHLEDAAPALSTTTGAGIEVAQLVRPDGSVRTLEIAESFLEGPGGRVRGSVLVLHDATEQRTLEQRLRQAQKLESLGRLAGGVAHDFNNMLAPILGYAQIARRRVGAEHPVAADLEVVTAAAERASELTRRLLALGRQQKLSLDALDLAEVVEGMRPILERLVSEDVRMVFDIAHGLPAVLADRVQIEQVILNLVMNAADAMPRGGTLTVRLREAPPDRSSLRHDVLLEVDDTGEGMDRATAGRIFEPFFTTKSRGRGTGLGLPTVFGIVEQHEGRVEVSSAPGEGSIFRVSLPVLEGPLPARAERKERPSHERLVGRALVVEDEPLVRRLIGDVLRQQGFEVVVARDGEEALAAVEGAERPPDLVVSDVIMPEMNGPEVVEKLRARIPGLRCIFVSGHTEDALDLRGGLPRGTTFLRKPFGIDELVAAARDAMGTMTRAGGGDESEATGEVG